MNQRKQGRRSAEDAKKTRTVIMQAAADMFCEFGFERVSLRNISEKAGVSHSLIRHHFGSKEQIWYAISDCLDSYIKKYMQEVIRHIPEGQSANITLYIFVVRMHAMLLVFKQPIQLMADAMRQENELFDYFLDDSGEIDNLVNKLTDQFNLANPDHQVKAWEIKWQLIMSAHSAASMAPFMIETWRNETADPEQCLLLHWELFNKQMAASFRIADHDVLHVNQVSELVYHVPCDWGECNLLQEK